MAFQRRALKAIGGFVNDDRTLFDGLRDSVSRRLEGRVRAKLSALSPDQLVLRAPIVYAIGRSPG